jgi:hypothetical protein
MNMGSPERRFTFPIGGASKLREVFSTAAILGIMLGAGIAGEKN